MLEDQYKIKSTTPSDVNEHLPTLCKLAEECTHITEAGVRSVVSSYAFATALKGKADHTLVQVDLVKSPNVTQFQAECKAEGVHTLFYEESDLTCPLADTDMFFIDTWHIYGHLKRELARWHSYTKKYIVMHDTTVDEWLGETIRNGWNAVEQSKQTGIPVDEITKGLWPAIDEFLKEHPEWLLEKRYTNNNGLTILKRRPANDSFVIGFLNTKGGAVTKALSCLLDQTVDKARTHIVLASLTEVPEHITFELLNRRKYASVTQYVGNHMHEYIVGKALELGAHACLMESRHLLEPYAIQTLVDSKEKGVIAPMLTSQTRYSNYHTKVDANGYCLDDPMYDDFLYKRVKGQIAVPVVNGIYFVHHNLLPQISYTDGSKRDSYVIMSDGLRKKGISQYLDNRRDYGTIV